VERTEHARRRIAALAGSFLVLLFCAASQRTVARPQDSCDRACLIGIVDGYVQAMLSHDPSHLPVSGNIKFTENLVPLQFGRQGLWATVNGRRDFNIYAADPARGDIVWFGILKENDKPVMTAIRLKVAARRITEAETLVGRAGLGAADTVAGPRPDFAAEVPLGQRSTREKLIAIADSNWDAMEQGNGNLAPYAADCERYDNGHKTTNGPSPGREAAKSTGGEAAAAANQDIGSLGCYGQMNSGRFKNGNKVDPRRIWAVDVEYGLAVGLFTPNVPGTARSLTLRDGHTITMGPDELVPFTIEQVEMFKIVNGEISRVEVVLGPRVPYGTRSPFDMQTLWEPR
jgi:hypothetical protein